MPQLRKALGVVRHQSQQHDKLMTKIEILNSLELHDANVEKLDIDFSQKTLRIKVEILNNKKTLTFKDIRNLQLKGNHKMNELEISTVNFMFDNEIFTVEFVFLLGFGLPSITLNFKFKDFEIATS
ncbi:hypothetical protein [Flavobacterium sp. 3HN19-14]|uniref:hypothetical protein n=1 Tax=Flavobacterium sp. 3HN19-14 TaxID=3448133 RepID=UPI003EE3651B